MFKMPEFDYLYGMAQRCRVHFLFVSEVPMGKAIAESVNSKADGEGIPGL